MRGNQGVSLRRAKLDALAAARGGKQRNGLTRACSGDRPYPRVGVASRAGARGAAPACWRSISRSMVASVIELNVALAFSSISASTAPSARSTGVASPSAPRARRPAARSPRTAGSRPSASGAGVAGEAVAAADAAHRLDDAGARQLGAAPWPGGAPRRRTCRRSRPAEIWRAGSRGELEHAVQRERGVLLQLHRSSVRCSGLQRRSTAPAIMPWLRKNDRISVLSRRQHGAQLAHAGAPEARADRLPAARADARQARAAGRRRWRTPSRRAASRTPSRAPRR